MNGIALCDIFFPIAKIMIAKDSFSSLVITCSPTVIAWPLVFAFFFRVHCVTCKKLKHLKYIHFTEFWSELVRRENKYLSPSLDKVNSIGCSELSTKNNVSNPRMLSEKCKMQFTVRKHSVLVNNKSLTRPADVIHFSLLFVNVYNIASLFDFRSSRKI